MKIVLAQLNYTVGEACALFMASNVIIGLKT